MSNARVMTTSTVIDYFFNRSILELAPHTDGNFTITNASVTANGALYFSPGMYYLIGTLMIIIMVTGFSTNLAILYTYATNRKIRTVDNTLIIGLALSDIGQAIFGIPFVAISSFSKQWIFGHVICQYYAFITTCFGIAQISMLTVIAMERYFVIVRHDRRLTNTPCRCVIIILCSFLYGSSWATGPLLGWSGYKEEEIGIACCVKWEVKDGMAFSYTISLCTFGWFIPLFLIAFGYISIACSIYNERNKRMHLRRTVLPSKTNRERKVAITVLIMIGAFIISWTPYSAVSLWSAVGDFHSIPLWVQVAPAVFAKCSIIWNPLIYVARHKNFRKGVKESLSFLKFWDKKYKYYSNGGKNNFQPSTKLYKATETRNGKSSVRQSITSDNFVTYMESPAISNSSLAVIVGGLSSFKRARMRYLALFSTLNNSQQTDEKSESGSSETVKNLVPCESKCIQTDKVIVHIPTARKKEISDKYVQTDLSHQISKNSLAGQDKIHEINLDAKLAGQNGATEMDESNDTTNLTDVHLHSYEKNSSNVVYIDTIESNIVGISSPTGTTLDLNEELGINTVDDENESSMKESQYGLPVSLKFDKASPSRKLDTEKTKSLEVLKEKRKLLKQKLEIIYHDSQPFDLPNVSRDGHGLYKSRDCLSVSQTINRETRTENIFKDKHNLTNKINEEQKDTPPLIDIRNPKQRSFETSLYQRSTSKAFKPSYVQKRKTCREVLARDRNFNDSNNFEMRTYIYKPTRGELQLQEIENDSVVNLYASNVRVTDADEKATIIRQSTV